MIERDFFFLRLAVFGKVWSLLYNVVVVTCYVPPLEAYCIAGFSCVIKSCLYPVILLLSFVHVYMNTAGWPD